MGGDKIASLDVGVAVERAVKGEGVADFIGLDEPYVLMIVVGENGKGTVSHAYMRRLEFETSISRIHVNADIQFDGYSQTRPVPLLFTVAHHSTRSSHPSHQGTVK